MYDAFIAEKYEDKKNGGKEKARFTRVGVAFDSDNGGFDLESAGGDVDLGNGARPAA